MTTLTATTPAVRVTDPPRRGLKILLLGVFSYGSTDVWKLLALRRLGHQVVPHPYRDIPVRELFPQGTPFDLVFVSKGVPLSAEDFAHLETLGRHRLLWWPDPFENWNDELTAVLKRGRWDFSATSWRVLSRIVDRVCGVTVDRDLEGSMLGGSRIGRILEGCDCEGPRPEWTPETIEPSLLHFGGMTERRAKIIAAVRAAGVPVHVLDRPLYGAQLQREILKHAAVLGINSSPDLYSNRVQTVLAMGGVIIQENAPELVYDTTVSGVENGPLGIVFREAGWAEAAGALLRDPAAFRREATARRVFDRYRWERVMERAIAFATGAAPCD